MNKMDFFKFKGNYYRDYFLSSRRCSNGMENSCLKLIRSKETCANCILSLHFTFKGDLESGLKAISVKLENVLVLADEKEFADPLTNEPNYSKLIST